jgi:peptidoglycan/LPS O-acetylase OafA/YrhL
VAIAGSIVLLWGAADTPGVDLPPASALPLFAVFGQNLSDSSAMTLNPPTWTLAIEASFYLALPAFGAIALRLAPTRSRQALLPLALIAIGLAWNTFTGVGWPYDKLLPTALSYFGAGMLAAVLLQGRAVTDRAARILLLGGVALVLLDGVLHVGVIRGPVSGIVSGTLRDTLAAVGFAAILIGVAGGTSHRLFGARPMVAAGAISYGIYLWHLPLMLALRSVGLLPLALLPALLVVLPVAIGVAALSWFAVERPAIRWAHSTTKRPEPARRPAFGGHPARPAPLPSEL